MVMRRKLTGMEHNKKNGDRIMNRYAMFHAANSAYCFPVSEKEIVLKLRTARDDMRRVQVFYESKYVIAERRQCADMKKYGSSELYDYYVVKLQLEDTRLAYVFFVDDGEKQYFFSEDGVTEEYDYSLGFYNFFQYPYINRADIPVMVDWMKDAVFYQIFVDRFYRGDGEKEDSYINLRWGDIPTPKSFAGGDLKGITEKLEYIASLGCNALYLTPIFRSISNHKYDIMDYYQIDAQFGSSEDLKELIRAAHARGMRVVLDAVFNHCSEQMVLFQDVLQKGRDSQYYDWFIIRGDRPDPAEGNYEMFAACTYMPKLNTSHPQVQQYLAEIGCYYLREYQIDGWRLDVCDEVSHDFWRYFRKEVKKVDPEAVIIGENWHDASDSLRGDQYDSIMNYAFTKACLDYFAKGTLDAQHMAWRLNDIRMRNTDTVNQMMLNLLDSHDTHRFFSEVGEDPAVMKAALSLLYLFPGVPCIFYGTEILTPGGYDPDCRRCMDWKAVGASGPYSDVMALLQKLSWIRREYRLADGQVMIQAQNEVLVLTNRTKTNQVILLINLTREAKDTRGITVAARSHEIVITERGNDEASGEEWYRIQEPETGERRTL